MIDVDFFECHTGCMKLHRSVLLTLVFTILLFGCTDQWEIDYLVLVNKDHALPEAWEESIEPYIIEVSNTIDGDDRTFRLEKETYEHFISLREELLEEDIRIEIDSATRTVNEQKELAERFTEEFGEDYVQKYVAVPGYSEHHTGLVVDICIVKDGEVIDDNDAMKAETEINEKIFEKLADHGFILRYPEGKEDITGYSYESWHYRYVGSTKIAHAIMDNDLTLEEYLEK